MPGNDFTIEDAPSASGGFSIEDAPATSQTVSQTPQSAKPSEKNPFAMIGEGEETQAAGNAAAAPGAVPMFAAEGGTMLGGPGVGAAAYAGTKALMAPEEVKAHPIRTAAETAGIAAGPYVVGKAAEYLNPVFKRLASGAGEMYDYLTTPAIKAAPEAEAAIAPAATAPTPPTLSNTPARTPAPAAPLTNRAIGQKITEGVQEAAGTKPGQPIYPRPARGSVGAQTVGEHPNIDIAGPRIQTPSRTETATEELKNRVPGSNPLEKDIPLREQPESPARTPQPHVRTNPDLHPMDSQVKIVNGPEVLSKVIEKPEFRDDVLDLTGEQLREVLRKSGENMENIQTVGKSAGKAARGGRINDPTNISREDAFHRLFEKGYDLPQILKEAPERTVPAKTRVPFGPPRTPKTPQS